MVSLETATRSVEQKSSPRISFSADFLDEKNIISISPTCQVEKKCEKELNAAEFEFLSSNFTSGNMTTADELIFDGKLLPYWQMHHAEKLNKISLKTEEIMTETEVKSKEEMNRPTNWFIDEDPSPRPPTCNVLWKELLRLKKQKQRPSSLSPSSSSSSSSSSSNSEISPTDESKEKHVNKIKKRLERSRSATISVRPLITVPICTQGKNNALPPLFSLKKGRLER
ncbi:PREDICTED: uncharacterized protein LOC109219634 [Nicotiana attenuata]|uniref:Uncharacterized protein n=1 Tax=Nicotiana attenuata TaxID=49451 RepID=A0A1J6JSZ3_NICAT|nr:PREDICTED: uncharacterized protein LOC109219634 [Nicotiana attenuata]OIT20853.1 hypothetical protein A4A49_39282 [Nicotiana attenuata]